MAPSTKGGVPPVLCREIRQASELIGELFRRGGGSAPGKAKLSEWRELFHAAAGDHPKHSALFREAADVFATLAIEAPDRMMPPVEELFGLPPPARLLKLKGDLSKAADVLQGLPSPLKKR